VRQALKATFLTPNPKAYRADAPDTRTKGPRGILGPLHAVANLLADFAGEDVLRKEVSPTHGWRRRFNVIGRNPDLGIQQTYVTPFRTMRHAQSSNAGSTRRTASVVRLTRKAMTKTRDLLAKGDEVLRAPR
jgi:hypothetical protein